MRVCPLCGESDQTKFYTKAGYCKPCHIAYATMRMRIQRLADPEVYRAKLLEQRKTHAKRRVLEKRPCLHCGTIFDINYPSQLLRKKFCSRQCIGRWHGPRNIKAITSLVAAAKKPEAIKKRAAAARRGAAHPMWIDGRSATQRPRAATNYWRREVFKRDDHTCQICNTRGGTLNADHIKPYATHPELRFDVSNGRTLCLDCHRKTPTYGAKFLHQLRRDHKLLARPL